MTVTEQAIVLRFCGRTYAFVVADQGTVEVRRIIWGRAGLGLVSDLVDATVVPYNLNGAIAALMDSGWLGLRTSPIARSRQTRHRALAYQRQVRTA